MPPPTSSPPFFPKAEWKVRAKATYVRGLCFIGISWRMMVARAAELVVSYSRCCCCCCCWEIGEGEGKYVVLFAEERRGIRLLLLLLLLPRLVASSRWMFLFLCNCSRHSFQPSTYVLKRQKARPSCYVLPHELLFCPRLRDSYSRGIIITYLAKEGEHSNVCTYSKFRCRTERDFVLVSFFFSASLERLTRTKNLG